MDTEFIHNPVVSPQSTEAQQQHQSSTFGRFIDLERLWREGSALSRQPCDEASNSTVPSKLDATSRSKTQLSLQVGDYTAAQPKVPKPPVQSLLQPKKLALPSNLIEKETLSNSVEKDKWGDDW